MSKKRYTQEQALSEVFKNASPTGLGKKLYDKVIAYRIRYERNELGEKAISNLLASFGFEKDIVYRKVKKKTNEK